MDRTKIKDQFGQFGRRREYGADDDRTTSRQMKKSRRMCAAAAVLFAFAAAFALTTAVYRMDAKAQSDLQRRLSEEVLRFHVLANSDSREDQRDDWLYQCSSGKEVSLYHSVPPRSGKN